MSSELRGRGAGFNPAPRFSHQHIEEIDVDVPADGEGAPAAIATRYYDDKTQSVLAENDSADLPFRFSVNPYRGCEHGCIYCYARNSHEYLGFSAGIDFETRIVVKKNAPALLRAEFAKRSWRPEIICISGNTDPWQPVERALGITRALIQVFRDHHHPVAVITKSAGIMRDADLLGELARDRLCMAAVSITSLDPELSLAMEPRAAAPARRLEAVRCLSAAGVPVGVNVAPVVPGLNDAEIPAILEAAREAGAVRARFMLVRLPGAVEGLFVDWLERHFPKRKAKVLARLRDVRGGALNDTRFGRRQTGEGAFAAAIANLFDVHARRLGFTNEWPPLRSDLFVRPGAAGAEEQLELWPG